MNLSTDCEHTFDDPHHLLCAGALWNGERCECECHRRLVLA